MGSPQFMQLRGRKRFSFYKWKMTQDIIHVQKKKKVIKVRKGGTEEQQNR